MAARVADTDTATGIIDGAAIGAETVLRRRFERALPRPAEQTEDHLFSADGALIAGADVANTPRDSWRRRLLAVADVAGLATGYLGVWLIAPPPGQLIDRLPLASMLLVWVVVNKLLGLYDRDDKVIHNSTLDELPKLLHSLVLGVLLVFMCAPLLLPMEIQREQAGLFFLFAAVTVPAARGLSRTFIRHRFAPERCAILGAGAVADIFARKIESHPEYGVELVGYLDDERTSRRRAMSSTPFLGDIESMAAICREHGIERVIVAFAGLSNEKMLGIVRTAKHARMKVTIVPRLYEVIGHSVVLDEVEGMTVLSLRGLSRSRSSLALKRFIDILVAGVGLVVISPLLALIALAIKLDSPGPVLYMQPRMGRRRPFQMLKFRSMVVGADDLKPALRHLNMMAGGPMFKIAEDPRVTRVGRWLRRTSLDELPQLWNVLRGEMSLVGPRPLILAEDDHVIGWHRTRLDLTPGLTGPWQVAGRNSVPFQEMVKMDYLYVAEWSLWNDIRLLLRTAPVVLFGRGH